MNRKILARQCLNTSKDTTTIENGDTALYSISAHSNANQKKLYCIDGCLILISQIILQIFSLCQVLTMTIINGSLFEDIVKFHKPEHKANTAAIVIDEMDKKSGFETVKNWGIRKQNQEETLLFCKKIGCKIIVVHEESYSRPKHIYGSIGEPDFSCIKHDSGVLEQRTNLPLLPYLIKNEITSLVLMGGRYDMCV